MQYDSLSVTDRIHSISLPLIDCLYSASVTKERPGRLLVRGRCAVLKRKA